MNIKEYETNGSLPDDVFNDIMKIFKRLTKTEKDYLGERYVNAKSTRYTCIIYNNHDPIAFAQGFSHDGKELISSFAIIKRYRGRGYAKLLISKIESFTKKNKYESIIYLVKNSNKISMTLAKNQGYELLRYEGDHHVYIKRFEGELV